MKTGEALKGLQERSGREKRNMKKVNGIEKVLLIILRFYVKKNLRKILSFCLLDCQLILF